MLLDYHSGESAREGGSPLNTTFHSGGTAREGGSPFFSS